jgi:GxxExxY protein
MQRELLYADITEAIIGAAFEVHNVLGYGFLERVYQRAMQVELRLRGFKADIENEIVVRYKGIVVGLYKADIWVNDSIIVELKVAKSYCSEDEAQLLNELKATGVKVGLLINFGREKVEFKRFVF